MDIYKLHQRVKLTCAVSYADLSGSFDLPEGATGRVVELGDAINPTMTVMMDHHFPQLDEWDNRATFDTRSDGDLAIANAPDCLTVTAG